MSTYYDTNSPEVVKLWQEELLRAAMSRPKLSPSPARRQPLRRRLYWGWYSLRERLARWIFPEGGDA